MGGLANGGVIHVEIIANGAHHDLARVEPHAHLQEGDPVGPLDFGGILLHGGLHAQGGIAGPYRMVFMGQGRPKEGHNAVAHHLVDGALIAMHRGHHAFQHGIEELAGLLRIAVRQQLHGALEVGKQHRDLLAFAFQGTARGEDLLRKIGRGVGEWRRGAAGRGGHCGNRASVACPDQATPRVVTYLWMGIEEFVFQIVQGVVIQLKLSLEGPIGHAAPLAQQRDHLIQDRDKVHPAPSLPFAVPACAGVTPS